MEYGDVMSKDKKVEWKIKLVAYRTGQIGVAEPFVKKELDMVCEDGQVSGRIEQMYHILKIIIENFDKEVMDNDNFKSEKLG